MNFFLASSRASLSSLLNASHAIYIRRSLTVSEKKKIIKRNSNDRRKRWQMDTSLWEVAMSWMYSFLRATKSEEKIDKIFRPIDSVNQVRRTLRAYFYAFLSLSSLTFFFGGWEECRKHERTLTNKKTYIHACRGEVLFAFFSLKVVSLFLSASFFFGGEITIRTFEYPARVNGVDEYVYWFLKGSKHVGKGVLVGGFACTFLWFLRMK